MAASRPLRAPGPLVAVVAGALCAGLAGCGEAAPSEERRVRDVLVAFGRATAAKDYRRLCRELLAPSLLEEVSAIGLPCETAVRTALEDLEDPRLTVGAIVVTGERATAQVRTSAAGQEPSRDVVQLEKVDGNWRIASLTGAGG
jgi:hypothetical protein